MFTIPSSILFRPGEVRDLAASGPMPPFAIDLHLDEVAVAFQGDRAGSGLAAPLFERLRDPDAVAFRHEVFRDLEATDLRSGLAEFVARMGAVEAHLTHAAAIAHPLERQRWQLEAARTYAAAVTAVARVLEDATPTSRGLGALRASLHDHVDSEGFTAFVADTSRMLAGLAGVTYRLRIDESRIVVGRHDGEADYGAEVLATFARFRRTAAPAPLQVDAFHIVDMNMVEVEVLERVARLHPSVFEELDGYVRAYSAFLDPAVAAFANELPFYLAWLDLIGPLQEAGLAFCYPQVSATDAESRAHGLFDLALALRRQPPGTDIVTNDLELSGAERLLVITGPNQGGKTAFARAIGQVCHLAAIGVPVPGSAVRLGLGETVHTLFARSEDPGDLTGRLEAELTRARAILDDLRPGCVVILNESFSSTTVDDALALDRALIGETTQRGAICVVVTFLGELAADDPSTVSMTSVMDSLDPTRPTFRFERRPPDPLAHARAVADVYGLGYDAVRARIAEATTR